MVCFNSSKCLESLPGIAGVLWRSDLALHPSVPVLNVGAYARGMASTPNVQAYVALDLALDLLAAEDRPGRYERLARRVWTAGGEHFDLLLDEADRSHVLTAFRLGRHTIDELFGRAYEHGMVIYPGQAELRDEIFRVANMGALMSDDTIDELFAVLTAEPTAGRGRRRGPRPQAPDESSSDDAAAWGSTSRAATRATSASKAGPSHRVAAR